MRNDRWFILAFVKVALLTFVVLIISGCSIGGAFGSQPTATVIRSATATLTLTPTQTFTPQPTNTSTPTSTATTVPTPASVGAAVPYRSLEITVIGVTTHDLIVPGGLYYYYPTDRTKIFLDLGVLVKNLNPGHAVSVQWNNVVITEANGKSSQPSFADTKMVDVGKKYDPFKIGIATQVSGNESVSFDKDTYLRLIFVVAKKQKILFGIEDSPRVIFTLN